MTSPSVALVLALCFVIYPVDAEIDGSASCIDCKNDSEQEISLLQTYQSSTLAGKHNSESNLELTVAGEGSARGTPLGDIVEGIGGVVHGVKNVTDDISSPGDTMVKIQKAAHSAEKVAKGVTKATKSVKKVADKVKDQETSLKLDGNSKSTINKIIVIVAVGVLCVIGVAYIFELYFPQYALPKHRPPLWVLIMTAAANCLLIPSYGQILFSFKIVVNLLGMRMNLTHKVATSPDGCITESVVGLVGLLAKTGSVVGASLVVLYAMIVPALKLLLLCIGEFHRTSKDPFYLQTSRVCILVVQFISKWACPDMFAYILLLYLLKRLQEKSDLLDLPSKLDLGFTLFSFYCVLSTFACLFIKPPQLKPPELLKDDETVEERHREPVALRFLGKKGLLVFSVVMFLAFSALLAFGMSEPCMALKLNTNAFVKPNGPAPRSDKPLLDSLHLSEIFDSNVNICACLRKLFDLACSDGDGQCIVALIMMGVFAVTLTWLDMLAIVYLALRLNTGTDKDKDRAMSLKNARNATKFLGKISMLDVACMGVVVVCFAASIYKSMGVEFFIRHGLFLMIGAEVIHYAISHAVNGAADYVRGSALPVEKGNKDNVASL